MITGATGGLGRAAARAFAERGASLAVVGTDAGRLQAVIEEVGLPAERALSHRADLRDAAAARELARVVLERFDRVDVLLHLVGGWVGGKEVSAASVADLAGMLDQHVWTTWHLLQAFAPRLAAGGWGRILVVSSPVAARPAARSGPYAAAKAAEEALVLAVAQEVRERGVTANVLQVRAIDEERRRPAGSVAATPQEIVAAMLFLCSAEGGMVNGARLPLTGGAA